MRNILILTATFSVLCAFNSLNQTNVQAQGRHSKKPAQTSASTLNLDQQAEQQALSFWNSRVTSCGGDFYTRDRNYIHQFKNLNIQVTPRTVSTADKLNGIQWLGNTHATVSQSRTYSSNSTLYQNGGWSKWSEGFTSSLGGIGLDASLRKENGRWTIIPSAISQSGVLKPISCSDASNPIAFYRRLEDESLNSAVRSFRANSEQFGIFAENIPSEMWAAMYEYGYPNNLNWVFLGPNGGWGVSGKYRKLSGLSIKVMEQAEGRWLETITADGGYVLLGKDSRVDYKGGSYLAEKIPQSLIDKLDELINKKFLIQMVRVSPSGGWFVFFRDYSGIENWSWNGMPDSAGKAFNEISQQGFKVKDVAFLPDNGYLIVYGGKATVDEFYYYSDKLPESALKALNKLYENCYGIENVSFGQNNSWIIKFIYTGRNIQSRCGYYR